MRVKLSFRKNSRAIATGKPREHVSLMAVIALINSRRLPRGLRSSQEGLDAHDKNTINFNNLGDGSVCFFSENVGSSIK